VGAISYTQISRQDSLQDDPSGPVKTGKLFEAHGSPTTMTEKSGTKQAKESFDMNFAWYVAVNSDNYSSLSRLRHRIKVIKALQRISS
jgi:hypothetical protein